MSQKSCTRGHPKKKGGKELKGQRHQWLKEM
jgi:hypothetical protein